MSGAGLHCNASVPDRDEGSGRSWRVFCPNLPQLTLAKLELFTGNMRPGRRISPLGGHRPDLYLPTAVWGGVGDRYHRFETGLLAFFVIFMRIGRGLSG